MLDTLKGAILSFYSRPFYSRLAHRRRGIGFGFINLHVLLSLLIVMGALLKIGGYGVISEAMDNAPQWTGNMPAITIKDGKMSIDKPVPFRINVGNADHHAWVVIDTNYKTGDIETLRKFMEENSIPLLVTGEEFIILKERQHTLEIHDMKEYHDFTIGHDKWEAFGQWAKNWGMSTLVLGLLVIFYLTFLLTDIFVTFLTGIIALIVSAIAKANLELASAMRVVAAFRIPVLIISAVTGAIGLPGVFSWIGWLGYLIFSVVASKSDGGLTPEPENA